MMKRLMSLLLCLVMVLAVLPLGVQAEETAVPEGYTRVYCQAPTSWSSCKVYWWGRSNYNPVWPGIDMLRNSDDVWYYDVPSDVTGLLFNDGNGSQTGDLQLPVDGQNMFSYSSGKWVDYGTAVVAGDYYVAGTANLCGVEWTPDTPENKMQDEDQDGVYTINYTNVAAGTYEFKITNGTWDQSWGLNGGVDNYQLILTQESNDIEIRFDSRTGLVEAELLNVEPEPIEPDDTFMSVTVLASDPEVQVGDQVDYTVYAHGRGITAMQFYLIVPQGMTYVAGSAAVTDGLRESLAWGAVDWTESSMIWTGYNDLPTTFEEGTAILTFSCIAAEVGSHKINLYDLLPFDADFQERSAELTVEQVTVTCNHSYENGSCIHCGGAAPEVTVPTLTLKVPTLEFKDMICITAFYTAENIDDVEEMGMITYSTRVDTWNVETAEHVIPGAAYDAASGRYYSASQGIHAKYLADAVYLAVYAKLTDGTYAYSKLASYSAVQYATNQLKNSTDVKLKQLVASMLQYGAEAQLYFGHNTDALASSSMTAEQLALPETYRADMISAVPVASQQKQGDFYNNKGFSKRSPAISFEGAFCINYFFTPAYTPDNGITLYYWTAQDFEAADVLSADNATGSVQMTGSGEYRADITGISAKALSEAVYVAAVYTNGGTTWTSGVLGYSIGSYCSSQAAKGGDIAALAMATAVYGYHAKQYFG